jgi:hypothetical protein
LERKWRFNAYPKGVAIDLDGALRDDVLVQFWPEGAAVGSCAGRKNLQNLRG